MTDVNTETNNIAQAERSQEETPSAAAAIEAAKKDAAEAKAPDGSGDAGAVEKNDEPKTTTAAGSDAEKSTTTTTAAAEKDDDHRSEAAETDARGWRIVQRGVAGVVCRWNLRGGFGFVQRDDTREELFVHHSAVVRAANARNRPRRVLERSLLAGQQIEFDVVDGPKGVQAANVTGPESAPVPALKLCKFHRAGAGGSERPQRRTASPRGRRSKAGAKEKPSDKEQKPAENGAAKEPAAAANDGEKRAANGKKRSRKAKRNRGRTARPKKDTTETAAANDDDADGAAKDDVEPPTPQPEAVDAQQIAAAAAVGAE